MNNIQIISTIPGLNGMNLNRQIGGRKASKYLMESKVNT